MNPVGYNQQLTHDDLRSVNGGMKYEAGVKSPHVVDARGGSLVIYGIRLTYDLNGNCTSIAPVNPHK